VNISFTPGAWEDYQYWVGTHTATAKRIVALLKDIARSPTEGIGAPKALRHSLHGLWSRRITAEPRVVYAIPKQTNVIHRCRYHYG
jgi:toxin YoeB